MTPADPFKPSCRCLRQCCREVCYTKGGVSRSPFGRCSPGNLRARALWQEGEAVACFGRRNDRDAPLQVNQTLVASSKSIKDRNSTR